MKKTIIALLLVICMIMPTACAKKVAMNEGEVATSYTKMVTTEKAGTMANYDVSDYSYYTETACQAVEDCAMLYIEDFNTEEYNSIKENGFVKVANMPISTFAADVDTGSLTNFRRMLQNGYSIENIPEGAIRTEEFINYFDYEVANNPEGKFSVKYETHSCPWNEDNRLLCMTVQANETESRYEGSNFVYLIDSSGSMSDCIGLVKESFKILTESLDENDKVSIVTYSGSSRTVLEGESAKNYKEIAHALDRIMAGGGTNGSGGIEAAYRCAEKNFIEGGNNRVIIASDGDMNLGVTSNSGLVELITEKKESGIFLTTLGFGWGNYSDANMESIADAGNGNYFYIDCLDEARRVLVEKLKETTETVAKDVKFQVEFNPNKVSEYRLLGYENRSMAAEDFADDTKDGGEVGAGQQVTVCYEIKLSDSAEGIELKYQNDRELSDAAYSDEILTLSVRYKEPEDASSVEEKYIVNDDTEEFTEDFRFVSGIIELSMVLRNSEYCGIATLETAKELIESGVAGDNYRRQFATLISCIGD